MFLVYFFVYKKGSYKMQKKDKTKVNENENQHQKLKEQHLSKQQEMKV